VETTGDESEEAEADSAVPDEGLSVSVEESEAKGASSKEEGENQALAEERSKAGGAVKGSSSGAGSGGEGARLSERSMIKGG
jgi:hypothetical protein